MFANLDKFSKLDSASRDYTIEAEKDMVVSEFATNSS